MRQDGTQSVAQRAQVPAGHPRRFSGRRGAARSCPRIRRGDDGARGGTAGDGVGDGGDGRPTRRPSAERARGAGRPATAVSGRRKPGPGESARALMKIYATYNIKGGVGKTSTAVN